VHHNRERTRWEEMIAACDNPSYPAWQWNGKLGVIIDPSWRDFDVFLKDIGSMPGYNSYLDRVPGTDCFGPTSTRWRVGKEKVLTLHGTTLTVTEWAKRLKLPKATIDSRIRKNLPVTQVLRKGRLYRQDLTDRHFGMIRVLRFDEAKIREDFWKCKCDCGSIMSLAASLLMTGNIRSCGCTPNSEIRLIAPEPKLRFKGTRQLSRLSGIKESTIRHRKKIGVHPDNLTQIQSIDKGKIYEYDGLSMTLEQWAVYLDEKVATLRNRLYSGWSFEDTIKIPSRNNSNKTSISD